MSQDLVNDDVCRMAGAKMHCSCVHVLALVLSSPAQELFAAEPRHLGSMRRQHPAWLRKIAVGTRPSEGPKQEMSSHTCAQVAPSLFQGPGAIALQRSRTSASLQ